MQLTVQSENSALVLGTRAWSPRGEADTKLVKRAAAPTAAVVNFILAEFMVFPKRKVMMCTDQDCELGFSVDDGVVEIFVTTTAAILLIDDYLDNLAVVKW